MKCSAHSFTAVTICIDICLNPYTNDRRCAISDHNNNTRCHMYYHSVNKRPHIIKIPVWVKYTVDITEPSSHFNSRWKCIGVTLELFSISYSVDAKYLQSNIKLSRHIWPPHEVGNCMSIVNTKTILNFPSTLVSIPFYLTLHSFLLWLV